MGLAYSKILERIDKHYVAAVAHYGEDRVFGVFLYGSPNYNTDTTESDVDTKCILIPDIYDLAIKPLEVKHLDVDGEVCECMTIMHMVENWKKQNINFLEIMFTPYCIINDNYADFWMTHRENEWEYPITFDWAEKIARYDVVKAVKSMSGQAIHTLKQDPTDLKKIMNGMRIMKSLAQLVTDDSASYCEIIRANPTIAGIRTGETPVPDNCVEDLITYFEAMIKRAEEYADKSSSKWEVDEYLNKFILATIRHRMSL